MKGLKISYKKKEPDNKKNEDNQVDDELKYIPKHKDEEKVKSFFNSSKAYDFTKKNEENNTKLDNLEDLKDFAIKIWKNFMKGDTIKSRQLNNTLSSKLTDIQEFSKRNAINSQIANAEDMIEDEIKKDQEITNKFTTNTGIYLDSRLPGDDEEEAEIVNNFMGYAKLSEEDKLQLEELKKLTLNAKKDKGGMSSEGENFFKTARYQQNSDEITDMEYDQMGLPKKKIKKDRTSDDSDEERKIAKKEKSYVERATKRKEKAEKRQERYLAKCEYCLSNTLLKDEQVQSISTRAFLLQSKLQVFFGNHFVIVPFSHNSSIRESPEEDYAEVRNYKKSLIQYFDSQNKSIIFLEFAVNVDKSPHAFIECFVMNNKVFKTAPSFFTQELNSMGSEWSTHRKVIPISREKGGLRKQIPENFPYFFVDFGLDSGMAHIIEKENEFNKQNIYDVICSILGQDPITAKNTRNVERDDLIRNKKRFMKEFIDFDWSETLT